jgi:hypothetical protein
MQEISIVRPAVRSAHVFAAAFVLTCAVGAFAIGSFPLAASVVTIFLFAGIHNLMEFRYFAARMPVRWGRSRLYYSVGIGGVIILAAIYLTLYFVSGNWLWAEVNWAIFAAGWNTAFVLWLATLVYLRGRQRPKSDWSWAFPAGFLLISLAWLVPQYWSLVLVYVHPFIAMWFLERQLRRTRPEWLGAYRLCLATIPVFVLLLWLLLANQPSLPEDSGLFSRIVQHAGGGILIGVSSHFLVATHVFLESIHYFVWILLLPLIDPRAVPWKFGEIPLFASKNGLPKLIAGLLIFGVIAILALWAGFALDYTTTRDIYFAFAIAHVLAEFPFLIKML